MTKEEQLAVARSNLKVWQSLDGAVSSAKRYRVGIELIDKRAAMHVDNYIKAAEEVRNYFAECVDKKVPA